MKSRAVHVTSAAELMAQEENSLSITTTLAALAQHPAVSVYEDCFVIRVTGMSSGTLEMIRRHLGERSTT